MPGILKLNHDLPAGYRWSSFAKVSPTHLSPTKRSIGLICLHNPPIRLRHACPYKPETAAHNVSIGFFNGGGSSEH